MALADAPDFLTIVLRARHEAEAALAASHVRVDEASRRAWRRQDHGAINAAQDQLAEAARDLERAVATERDLSEQLSLLSGHQQEREKSIKDSVARRRQLEISLAQLDTALSQTRAQRVHALCSDPSPDLVDRLREPPNSASGRAVWCHHALPIEATLDRSDGVSRPTGRSPQTDRARQEIAIASRLLRATSDNLNPTEWAELARQAATIRDQAIRDLRARKIIQQTMSPSRDAEHRLGVYDSALPREPYIGL
jgi:hypothetical protein